MIPSIYLNLEDDVSRIVARIKREKADKLVLVCPKRCFLFNDSINLRLLKKQTDLLKKEVFILTMDERGQMYAKEAGFQLKFLSKPSKTSAVSDIRIPKTIAKDAPQAEGERGALSSTMKEIKNIARLWGKHEPEKEEKRPKKEIVRPEIPEKRSTPTQARVSIPKVSVTESVFPREMGKAHETHKKKSHNQKITTVLVALSLVTVLAVVFVVLPKATVAVYPKSEPITRDIEVSASINVKGPDAAKLVMPATKISKTVEVANKFQSQGKREVGNKASGLVQIYNFTKSPLNLKAGTTVLTVGSKSYQLTSDISQLPPTVYKDAKTKEVDTKSLGQAVEVVAAEGGESYNLPEGTRMEIANQVFGSKPQFLYAKTASSITGGTSRYLSLVSEQDISSSQAALQNQALQSLRADLDKQGMALPDRAYIFEEPQFATDKPAGTESPSFQASLKVKVTGLAVNSADLEKLIYDRIGQTLSGDKVLAENPSPLDYKINKDPDLNAGLMVISVHFEGRSLYNVDLSDVASLLRGKTKNQVNEILRSKAEIDRIDITLAPVWQKNFPFFTSKIKVLTQNTPVLED